jgi:hypothetical protein
VGGISEISLARHIGIYVATRWWQRLDGKNHASLAPLQPLYSGQILILLYLVLCTMNFYLVYRGVKKLKEQLMASQIH